MNNHKLPRELGLFSAVILVIANMVGTGIFTTSGFIMAELGNGQTLLLCWFIGGVFALCGALCYGELGAMFPQPGGEYVFLRESFGKGVAFLSGWISLIVGFSAPIAAASIAFATYLFRVFPRPFNLNVTIPVWWGEGGITLSPVTLCSAAVITVLSLIHYHSVRLGTGVQNGMTLFKLVLIAALIAAALFVGQDTRGLFYQEFDIGSLFQGKFAVSLILVSFAYSGWNAAAYLGGEIRRPGRNIPLALLLGTLVVMGLYLCLNVVYIYALPIEKMSGVMEVGAASAVALFGENISRYFSGAIAMSLLSVLSAMIMTGPRVYYAMAKDGVFFELFGRVNKLHKTPAHAILLQAALAIVMVLTASFEKLLIYIGFTLSLCAVATVLGMMRIRMKQPEAMRSYKTFGYPVTPILFIAGNLWIIYFSIRSKPLVSLLGLGTMGVGILVYYYFRQRRPNHDL